MAPSQSFVIRTDASRGIGSGHVTRCLTLAEALRGFGADVTFICRRREGDFGAVIENRGFRLALLASPETRAESGPAPWLDVPVDVDAAQTIAAMADRPRPDWLIVDQYALDTDWERTLRPHASRLMVIDDLANRRHDCDLLLDQNLVADLDSRYAKHVSARTRLLLGPRYALLQGEYVALRETIGERRHVVERLLIYFGASDLPNVTGKAVSAVIALRRNDITADVVVGPTNPHSSELAAMAAAHPNIIVHGHMPSLAKLMASADLALGAGGAATWERLCLKLPALVVTLAENQRPLAEELDRRGVVRWLGDAETVDVATLLAALRGEIDDLPTGPALTDLVDGLGTQRVVDQLMCTGELVARKVQSDDESLLLSWANDPVTRANAFDPRMIEATIHHQWLADRLADPQRSVLFIAETQSGAPVGQVRFEIHGGHWHISYSVAPEFRGLGLGARVLARTIATLRQVMPGAALLAEVRPNNIASLKIFERLGFTRISVDDRAVTFTFV